MLARGKSEKRMRWEKEQKLWRKIESEAERSCSMRFDGMKRIYLSHYLRSVWMINERAHFFLVIFHRDKRKKSLVNHCHIIFSRPEYIIRFALQLTDGVRMYAENFCLNFYDSIAVLYLRCWAIIASREKQKNHADVIFFFCITHSVGSENCPTFPLIYSNEMVYTLLLARKNEVFVSIRSATFIFIGVILFRYFSKRRFWNNQ